MCTHLPPLAKHEQESEGGRPFALEELQQSQKALRQQRRLFHFVRTKLQSELSEVVIALDRLRSSKSWRWTVWIRKAELVMRRFVGGGTMQPALQQPSHISTQCMDSGGRAVCTILAKNYLAQARVFAESVHLQHPDLQVFVLLVDEMDPKIDLSHEPFTLVTLAELALPDLKRLCFQYSIKELSTALKPFFLRHVLREKGVSQLLYFDPDIVVFDSLSPLFASLDDATILLTPHVLTPIPPGTVPSEQAVLLVGIYNLGFIGVSSETEADRFLLWWSDRLRHQCIEDTAHGLFVDQRWIDLVPALFEDVLILKDLRCNVAYWNLHERRLTREAGLYHVNDQLLLFYHFSGFNPDHPDDLTVFACTHIADIHHDLTFLLHEYADRLQRAGYRETVCLPYAFGSFENGTPIPPLARTLFRTSVNSRAFKNPFRVGKGSFYAWLQTPRVRLETSGALTNFHCAMHASRPDLLYRYSLLTADGAREFSQWLLRPSKLEAHHFSPAFVASIHAEPTHRLCVSGWRSFPRKMMRFLTGGRRLGTLSSPLEKIDRLAHSKQHSPVPTHQSIPRPQGVNMVAYFGAESGVAQAGRLHALAIAQASLPHVFLDSTAPHMRRKHDAFFEPFTVENPYDINLLHLNADQLAGFYATVGRSFFRGHRTIGFWVWELSSLPHRWPEVYEMVDEIWTPSTFCTTAFAARTDLPITTVPHPIVIESPRRYHRQHFHLDEKEFVVLFLFDCLSIGERKNPLGVLSAFMAAFEGQENVRLVLKCSHGQHDRRLLNQLRSAALQHPSVRLIEDILPREEILDLLRACDVYMSLHRSEGFGLTIAEAMALGKPVIATDYGGSTDFVRAENAFPIPYRLLELDREYGVYPKGSVWADPDLAKAASTLRWIFEHREEAAKRAEVARADIARDFSLATIGERMRIALETARHRHSSGAL